MASRKTLIKYADTALSRYVRLSQAVKMQGYVYCVTCLESIYAGDKNIYQPMFWKGDGAQAGHFMAKGNGATAVRWLPHNVHVQCTRCNTHLSANLVHYTRYMDRAFGQDITDNLRCRKFKTIKYTDDDIKEIADLYNYFADELEKKL